jgi:hypothetical protein
MSYAPPPAVVAPTMPAVVAPPPAMALPSAIPIPQPPGAPPPRLTQGIPAPDQIERQKQAYAAALEKQLADAVATVQNETKIEKEMVAFKTQKDVAIFEAQVDEKLVEMLAAEDERAAFAKSELNKARQDRQIQLNNQAANLVMDYNMKQVMDDIQARKLAFESQYRAAEQKLTQDYGRAAMQAYGFGPGVPQAVPMKPQARR